MYSLHVYISFIAPSSFIPPQLNDIRLVLHGVQERRLLQIPAHFHVIGLVLVHARVSEDRVSKNAEPASAERPPEDAA